jgi:hypothetical protein
MDNESEVAYVRAVMENLPTLAKSPVLRQAAGPKKGKVFGPHNTLVCGIHSEGDPVQSNVLRPRKNGRAERWNPPTALPATGEGSQAVCPGGKDGSGSKCSAATAEIRANAKGIRLSQAKLSR